MAGTCAKYSQTDDGFPVFLTAGRGAFASICSAKGLHFLMAPDAQEPSRPMTMR